MKKIGLLMLAIVIIFRGFACATVNSQSPSQSEASNLPRLLKLELPDEAKYGDTVRGEVTYEGAIKVFYVHSFSPYGSWSFSFKRYSFQKYGIVKFHFFTLAWPTISTYRLISVYAEDEMGKKTNTLTKWITVR